MAEAYILNRDDNITFTRARAVNRKALAAAEDAVSARVIEAGGACDERAFLAAFYGHAVSSYYGEEDPRWRDFPQEVENRFHKLRTLQYKLGEPFAYRSDDSVNVDHIGVIGRNPDGNYYSPVLSYRIHEDAYTYLGDVVIGAWTHSRRTFSGQEADPRHSVTGLLHLERIKGGQHLTDEHEYQWPSMIVGMPEIRQAIARDPHYVTEGAWRNVDESVAKIRSFVGDALIGCPSYDAD